MKKRFIRLLVFAMAIVSMGALNSCKDYDEERVDELSQKLADQNATLTELIRLQVGGLQDQIDALQSQIDAIHSCDCDVAGAIKTALEDYLKQHPDGPTEADVIKIVNNIIADHLKTTEHVTKEQVEHWIQDAIAGIVSCNCEHKTSEQLATFISTVINQYLTENKYATEDDILTAEQVQTMIDNSLVLYATLQQLNDAKNELQKALDKANETITEHGNSITSLITTVSDLQTAVGTAQARADAAFELATTAAGNAETALKKAEEAFNKAKDAEGAAKDAADKAKEAFDKAKEAQDTAGEALGKAETALQNAEDAFNKAKEAADKAKEAFDKAKEAWDQADKNRQNLEKLSGEFTTLSGTVDQLGKELSTTTETAAKAWALAQANEITLNGMAKTLANLQTKDEQLQAQIDSLAALTKNFATQQDVVGALRYAMNLYNEAIAYTDQAVNNAITILLNKIKEESDNAKDRIDADSIRIDNLEDQVGDLDNKIDETNGKLDSLTQDLQQQLDDLKSYVDQQDSTLASHIDEANSRIDDTNDKIDSIANALEKLINEKDSLLNGRIDSTNIALEELKDAMNEADEELQKQINTLGSDLTQLLKALGKTSEAIDGLNGRVSTLEEKLNSMISSVVIQGTVNPAFGTFALPMGVKSNMLIAYYGENEHKTYFPTLGTSDLVNEQYALTEKDAEMLGDVVDKWSIPGQTTFFNEKEGNAGKVYLTVNPSATDFTGAQFSLVNSLDEESPIKLSPIKPSTDKLTFGWTRAGNAFYEAAATLKKDDVQKAKLNFDKSALQESVQQILNYKTETGLRFTQIGSAIYTAVNNIMDANAVKAPWVDKEGNETNYTYSEYGIGATAIKPLSFSFLHDVNMGKIPEINPFAEMNIDLNKMIDLDQFFTIIEGAVNEGTEFAENYDLKLKIQFDTLYIEKDGTVKTRILYQETDKISNNKVLYESWHDYDVSQIDLLMVEILNQRAAYWSAQLRYEFQKQIMSRKAGLIAKINDAAARYIGALKGAAQNVIDNMNGSISGSIGNINDYLEKINKFINTINEHLKNANNKLQVSMYFETADGQYHAVSQNPTWYTTFSGADEYVVYPTTYTAELIAPSYKKFIGITNVFKGEESAQGGNAECKKVLDDTNKAMGLEIMDGDTRAIAFKPAATGYKYEIFYAALDYSGKISQHKFYIYVK
jgi:predicted  nucleic acid-binding Zn-ribbon protein